MPRQELTRIVHLHELADGPVALEIVAGEESRDALARRFGLEAIVELRADVTARRAGGGMRVEGRVEGRPMQRCVVTDTPVAARVSEAFTVVFLPEIATLEEDGGEPAIDFERDEDFEPLTADGVDVGEVVAQTFSLALDPYPRADAAGEIGGGDWQDEPAGDDDREESPFAVLKNLHDMT